MAKRNDKITYKANTVIVDHETGEITKEEETTHVRMSNEPNYIKLYINTLLAFKDLPKTLNPLLLELLNCMSYADPTVKNGGQLIAIPAYIKQQIAQKLKMQVNTIDKSLSNLTKSGILKRIGTGTYQVNPNMFGKGEWKDIKAIKATFDYNSGKVNAELTTKESEKD